MARNILVVAAHPDDEALGCGGTLLRHRARGDRIHLLFMTDGVSARKEAHADEKMLRNEGLKRALALLTPDTVHCEDFPDNALDSVPLLEIVRTIERVAADCKPDIVYTHWADDLNIDHTITARATLTALRPLPQASVMQILAFEVPSSTEWTPAGHGFTPNHFVDIASVLPQKEALLRCYDSEMHPAPHARSYEHCLALATYRGHSVGFSAAEAFVVLRSMVR